MLTNPILLRQTSKTRQHCYVGISNYYYVSQLKQRCALENQLKKCGKALLVNVTHVQNANHSRSHDQLVAKQASFQTTSKHKPTRSKHHGMVCDNHLVKNNAMSWTSFENSVNVFFARPYTTDDASQISQISGKQLLNSQAKNPRQRFKPGGLFVLQPWVSPCASLLRAMCFNDFAENSNNVISGIDFIRPDYDNAEDSSGHYLIQQPIGLNSRPFYVKTFACLSQSVWRKRLRKLSRNWRYASLANVAHVDAGNEAGLQQPMFHQKSSMTSQPIKTSIKSASLCAKQPIADNINAINTAMVMRFGLTYGNKAYESKSKRYDYDLDLQSLDLSEKHPNYKHRFFNNVVNGDHAKSPSVSDSDSDSAPLNLNLNSAALNANSTPDKKSARFSANKSTASQLTPNLALVRNLQKFYFPNLHLKAYHVNPNFGAQTLIASTKRARFGEITSRNHPVKHQAKAQNKPTLIGQFSSHSNFFAETSPEIRHYDLSKAEIQTKQSFTPVYATFNGFNCTSNVTLCFDQHHVLPRTNPVEKKLAAKLKSKLLANRSHNKSHSRANQLVPDSLQKNRQNIQADSATQSAQAKLGHAKPNNKLTRFFKTKSKSKSQVLLQGFLQQNPERKKTPDLFERLFNGWFLNLNHRQGQGQGQGQGHHVLKNVDESPSQNWFANANQNSAVVKSHQVDATLTKPKGALKLDGLVLSSKTSFGSKLNHHQCEHNSTLKFNLTPSKSALCFQAYLTNQQAGCASPSTDKTKNNNSNAPSSPCAETHSEINVSPMRKQTIAKVSGCLASIRL